MAAKKKASTLKGDFRPTWCPGCGDFAVLTGLDRALVNLGLEPENIAICSGIGCSSRFPFFMRTYGFHSLHGRALPVATGLKLARPELTVIITGGDGDAVSIGGNHFMHALRRNVDLTYIMMDNQVYGMTKGQTSPTSQRGFVTRSTPYGALENAVDPVWIALSLGATYVAQGSSHNPKQLETFIRRGIEHNGMAVINVTSPCVTFNQINSYDFYRKHSFDILEKYADYDVSDRLAAMSMLGDHRDEFPLGVLYDVVAPTMDESLTALTKQGQTESMALEAVTDTFR